LHWPYVSIVFFNASMPSPLDAAVGHTFLLEKVDFNMLVNCVTNTLDPGRSILLTTKISATSTMPDFMS